MVTRTLWITVDGAGDTLCLMVLKLVQVADTPDMPERRGRALFRIPSFVRSGLMLTSRVSIYGGVPTFILVQSSRPALEQHRQNQRGQLKLLSPVA